MPKVYLTCVAANATAIANLEADDYGVTWPQKISASIGAKKQGDIWVPVVKEITAEYSRQERLFGGQTDITAQTIPIAVSQANYRAVLQALENLGNGIPTPAFYSLAAVRAHESQHAVRCRQALDEKSSDIEHLIEAVTTPVVGNETEVQAIVIIRALPEYDQAIDDSFQLWDARFDDLIREDHRNVGPCETAERRVTTGLIRQIKTLAQVQMWDARKPQVGLPTGYVRPVWPPPK